MAFAFNVTKEVEELEPRTYRQVVHSNNVERWKEATREEIDSLSKNQARVLVDRPPGKKLVVSNGCLS